MNQPGQCFTGLSKMISYKKTITKHPLQQIMDRIPQGNGNDHLYDI